MAVVDLQRQVNELRSDLLDERERRIERWQEANGFVLVFLGIAIGIGGLWGYVKFRSIADKTSIGAAAARRYMAVPPEMLPGTELPRGQLGNGSGPLPYLVAASPELTPFAESRAAGSGRPRQTPSRPLGPPRLPARRTPGSDLSERPACTSQGRFRGGTLPHGPFFGALV